MKTRTTPHQGARHRRIDTVDLHEKQEAPDDERRDTGLHANEIKRVDTRDNDADRTRTHYNESDERGHAS